MIIVDESSFLVSNCGVDCSRTVRVQVACPCEAIQEVHTNPDRIPRRLWTTRTGPEFRTLWIRLGRWVGSWLPYNRRAAETYHLDRDGHYIRLTAAHCGPFATEYVETNTTVFFKPSSPRRRRLIRQESNIRGRTYSQCSTRIFRSRGVGRGYSDSAIRNMFAEQTPHKIGVCFSTAQRALATKLSCSTFDEKATYKRFSF